MSELMIQLIVIAIVIVIVLFTFKEHSSKKPKKGKGISLERYTENLTTAAEEGKLDSLS